MYCSLLDCNKHTRPMVIKPISV